MKYENTLLGQDGGQKDDDIWQLHNLDRVKRIWYLSPMRAAKVQASLRIRAVSPEPLLLAHTIKRNLQTENQIPGPSEWLDMHS